jgi:acyl-CoA reductase-like NAD-dependent aldehyde dehydrogenase
LLQVERRSAGHFIAGAIDQSKNGGDFITVWRPATGEPLDQVPVGTETDVDRAVESATEGFASWRSMSAVERERRLGAVADLIVERHKELAELESANTGKSPSVAAGEIDGVIEIFRFYAGYPTKQRGAQIDTGEDRLLRYTRLEPLGVIGAITPWNYPMLIAAGKVAAALAAGCSVVLKPAPETPLTSIALAEIASDAGLPAGALNVVTGAGETGAYLVRHPSVAKVTFTGSTATGRQVARAAGGNIRPVTMELGGKSPNIVFDDIELDAAVGPVLMGALTNSGQECCAGARILVHREIESELVKRAAEWIQSCVVGADDHADVGPLISERQRERVQRFIDCAVAEGATLKAQGRTPEHGFYVPPTLITGVFRDMEVCREEIFGPVVTVQSFANDDEALRLANETQYGLAAGIWSSSIERALRFSRELEAGQVWINSFLSGHTMVPFGGAKNSGFGRELGTEGPAEFSYVKTVTVAGPPSSSSSGGGGA